MSIESVWIDAAYTAALTVYLIETKADEADKELAKILTNKQWSINIVVDVLTTYSSSAAIIQHQR